jgi:hypothetical protein
MTPSGIEPATFRFVAQYLNHCATISGPLSCKEHSSTLTKTTKGGQSTVSNSKFDENTCRLASRVTDGQAEGRGEPKRRVCATYPVRGAKYTRMNQYTELR